MGNGLERAKTGMWESSNEPIVATQGRDDNVPYSWQETERGVVGFMRYL